MLFLCAAQQWLEDSECNDSNAFNVSFPYPKTFAEGFEAQH